MRTPGLMSLLLLVAACERIDYIELAPTEVVFKQPNNQIWMEAKCMARNGSRAVRTRVSWSVADKTVAQVDEKGRLTPVGDGETEVIAKAGDVEARAGVQVIYVARVEVEPKMLRLKEGAEAATVTIKAFRKNGKPITDRSPALNVANKKIAQVVGAGAILPLDPGSTTVDVQVDGVHTSVEVVVEPDKQKK